MSLCIYSYCVYSRPRIVLSPEEAATARQHMLSAYFVAKANASCGLRPIGAVIVEPSSNQVLAEAGDDSGHGVGSSYDSVVWSWMESPPQNALDCSFPCSACMNGGHPLRHASMCCIESIARLFGAAVVLHAGMRKRDAEEFDSTVALGRLDVNPDDLDPSTARAYEGMSIRRSRSVSSLAQGLSDSSYTSQQAKENDILLGNGRSSSICCESDDNAVLRVGDSIRSLSDCEGQYYCSGFDLYTTHEPCIMCVVAISLHLSRSSLRFRHSCSASRCSLCVLHSTTLFFSFLFSSLRT